MERKWTERKYHFQDNSAVEPKDVKMYCNTNQFPEILSSGTHYKPNGERGLSKNYHLRFEVWNVDQKIIILGLDLCFNTFSHL